MDSYATLAQFYDGVQGDRVDHTRYLESLIDKHHPRAPAVPPRLDLRCTTLAPGPAVGSPALRVPPVAALRWWL